MATGGFRSRLWQELEPLVRHGAAALVLELTLLLLSGGAKLLASLSPKEVDYLSLIVKFDLWLVMVLLGLFGMYTIIEVAMRLLGSLFKEFKRQFSASSGDLDA